MKPAGGHHGLQRFGPQVFRSHTAPVRRKTGFNSRTDLFEDRGERDRYTCQYCGSQPGTEELTIDHVRPRAQGGTSTWENCVLACLGCNALKADRTPEQARMPLRKAPVRPTWQPLYARHSLQIESWSKFLSEAYWTVELKE